jgi:recombinational DNA repair protein (RecF pathway)
MIARCRKSLGTIFLSVLLINSGVAWALDDCSGDGERIGHKHVSHEQSVVGAPAANDAASAPLSLPHPETTRLHCLNSHYAIGLDAVAATAFQLEDLKKSVVFKAPLSYQSVLSNETKAWLTSLLDWLPSSSSPGSSSRYLFLSVLRI